MVLQGINRNFLANACIRIDTGNWEDALPEEISPEDMEQLRGIIASTSAGIVRLVLIAVAQDFVSFRGFQNPHLLSLIQAMEEVGENIGFEAWAMSPEE